MKATAGVVKTNLGNNLYDEATGGFFDAVPAADDYQGMPHYVVTTIADTFDHTNDAASLSIREAVDLANQASGLKTIWIPAWKFTLTRDRGTNSTDTNVSYGDLDIKNKLVVRGVAERTSIEWKSGVVDKVFDLLGDFDGDGDVDPAMPLDDGEIWDNQFSSSGAWEEFAADGDDDVDVDMYDEDIWAQNLGHTLQLTNVALWPSRLDRRSGQK